MVEVAKQEQPWRGRESRIVFSLETLEELKMEMQMQIQLEHSTSPRRSENAVAAFRMRWGREQQLRSTTTTTTAAQPNSYELPTSPTTLG